MNNTYNIKIKDIENSKNKTLDVNFEDFIQEIKSNTPIKAVLKAKSLDDFIEIKGYVQGNAILKCDLCLNEFEYKINFKINELFAKTALYQKINENEMEIELKDGQFITDLNGKNNIDIYDLLYQSVILDFPNKKVCGINCKGNVFEDEESFSKNQIDPRLTVFKTINIENKNSII